MAGRIWRKYSGRACHRLLEEDKIDVYRSYVRAFPQNSGRRPHQEAYALWWKIVSAVHHEERIVDVVPEAEEWWRNNCLYLDAVSRKAFRACLMFAFDHKDLLQGPRTGEVTMLIKENWEGIMKPGVTLVEGVALPNLGGAEKPSDIPNA